MKDETSETEVDKDHNSHNLYGSLGDQKNPRLSERRRKYNEFIIEEF